MSGPSLQGSVLGSVDLSSEDEALAGGAGGPSTDELDLGSLLLDPENAPLRRVLMDVNPALTVASMQVGSCQHIKCSEPAASLLTQG